MLPVSRIFLTREGWLTDKLCVYDELMSKPLAVTGRENPDYMLTPAQVEQEYGIKVSTLKDWRYVGAGPEFVKTSPGKGGAVR